MEDLIPPSRQALREALTLSDDVLKNIELNEVGLSQVALKCVRLARLLNDFDMQKIMQFEAGGYPVNANGSFSKEIFDLCRRAGRSYHEKNEKTEKIAEYAYKHSIEELEEFSSSVELSIAAARDPDVSISSANPNQFISAPAGNRAERTAIRTSSNTARKRLASRRSFLHGYALQKNHELKFSGIAGDIFSRTRERVDARIGEHVPAAVQKMAAVYENLCSENSEDWSNAVHSCRRILQDLADAVYPAREDKIVESGGRQRTIRLGPDNYVNRIVAFLEEKTDSERFQAIVGSHLSFMGERLDAVFQAAQKGSHSVVGKDEADRYVVYTYLLVGDVLSLT
jgi:hypothetical protein